MKKVKAIAIDNSELIIKFILGTIFIVFIWEPMFKFVVVISKVLEQIILH